MKYAIDETELARLEELLNTSGIGLLGWTTYGDKCNAAVIGEFCKFDDACTPVAGRVETEIYNEETGEYEQVADCHTTIAMLDDNANFTAFAYLTELSNATPALLATAHDYARLTAERDRLAEALRKIDQKGMTSSRAWITEIARTALEGT